MKRRKYAIVAFLVTLILFSSTASGCAAMIAENIASKEELYKCDTGNESVTAPFVWSDDDELNEDSIIHISNILEEEYVVVIKDTKESLGEDIKLSDYTDIVKSNLESEVVDAQSSEIKDTSVNGYNANYFELAGKYSDVKITYMYYCTETSDSYYQIIGWTLTSSFEDNKKEIKKIMNTFKASKEL